MKCDTFIILEQLANIKTRQKKENHNRAWPCTESISVYVWLVFENKNFKVALDV